MRNPIARVLAVIACVALLTLAGYWLFFSSGDERCVLTPAACGTSEDDAPGFEPEP